MAKATIGFAIALIALGLVGYFGTPSAPTETDSKKAATEASKSTDETPSKSKQSITALIPSFVGIAILIFGVIALNEPYRKHAMHAAATIGLLGFLAGAGRATMSLGKVFSGDPTLNWRSFIFVSLMAVICATFVAMCFNSFMAARKARLEEDVMNQRKAE